MIAEAIGSEPFPLKRETGRWCDFSLQTHRHGEETAEKPHFLLTRQEWIWLVLQGIPGGSDTISQMPSQLVLFLCCGLGWFQACRVAFQSSQRFPTLPAAKRVDCFIWSSSFLSHLINSQPLEEPLAVVVLPALLHLFSLNSLICWE